MFNMNHVIFTYYRLCLSKCFSKGYIFYIYQKVIFITVKDGSVSLYLKEHYEV